MTRLSPAGQHAHNTYLDRRYGPRVNRLLLIAFLQPELDQIGNRAFALRVGMDEDLLRHIIKGDKGHDHPRLDLADRLLTTGMGRPDLVRLVCPDVMP
jgi:hypothetical protein